MTQRACDLKLGLCADLPDFLLYRVFCWWDWNWRRPYRLAWSPLNLAAYLNSGAKDKAAKLIWPKEEHKPKGFVPLIVFFNCVIQCLIGRSLRQAFANAGAPSDWPSGCFFRFLKAVWTDRVWALRGQMRLSCSNVCWSANGMGCTDPKLEES